ncbi:DUF4179 domain-containing protein [bacterium C-53]|nr:DUF4179 domain-containing protein [Lachnospiraceae bacterium]RKJ11847.1 DUF4179 domain-containing protein [bacterium C-53]
MCLYIACHRPVMRKSGAEMEKNMKNDKLNSIEIPGCLTEYVQEGIQQGEKIYMRNKRKKTLIRLTATAAMLVLCMGIFASQPALAAKIPVIRDIFKLLQDDYSYRGDLDAVADKLEEPRIELNGNDGSNEQGGGVYTQGFVEDSAYTKTVDGVTVSVSETYCSTEAIYLSLTITCEDAFPDTMLDTEGKPILSFEATAEYSFRQREDNTAAGSLEGTFLDERTYAGIYRIDLLDIVGNDNTLKEEYRSIDEFDMDFCINRIVGDKEEQEKLDMQGKTDEELNKMSDEEWKAFMNEITPPDWYEYPNKYQNWWFDGPFAFQLRIKPDHENEKIVTVDEMNENGAGLYQVVKTKFEITVQEKCSEERAQKGVFLTVLDADGRVLPYGSSQFCDTYAINGRDVSKVFVYVCDYIEYMDEIKGHRNDADYQRILEQRSLYWKEVVF